MRNLFCLSVLLIFTTRQAECLSCYSCTVLNDGVCTDQTTTCDIDQSCYTHTRYVNTNDTLTTMGCMDNAVAVLRQSTRIKLRKQCSVIESGASSIIGRDIHVNLRRQGQTCRECCSTDRCNKDMCHHQHAKLCLDDELVDCARLNSVFNICTDVQHAKTICPHFCKLCDSVYSDCWEIKQHDVNAKDGVYDIKLWKTDRTIKVYCDMTTSGGGWTVFQNRYDGSTDFYRNYSEYENGFGNLNTEFWLGLDYIQEMTSNTTNELRLDLMSASGATGYQVLRPFSLSLPGYVLHVGNTVTSHNILSGTYQFTDGTYGHNGHAFSTFDHDVDSLGINCAVDKHGGWWYNRCFTVQLNGQYLTPGSTDHDGEGIVAYSFFFPQSLKQTRMSFRRT